MRAAFFHDHKFRRAQSGNHYSGGGLPYPVLQRYLRHFDSLLVVGRELPMAEAEDQTTLTLASGPQVDLRCCEARQSRTAMLFGADVRRHIRSVLEEVDCAIVRLPSILGLVACREAMRMKKPWMVEVVACAWDGLWNHGSAAGRPAAPLLYALNRHFIARAPYALYVSNKFLQRRYPCRGAVAACSDVVVGEADPLVLERRIRKIEERVPGAVATLGIVGSLDIDYKGHETAIRAVARLRQAGRNVRLQCLGGGNPARWRALAERLAVGDVVDFCGSLPSGSRVMAWMDELDLFLIPSLQEGLPRALVEAMSRGLPAIGARTGGIPELIAPELVHSPKDEHGLARHVASMMESTNAMRIAAARNHRVAAEYSEQALSARRSAFLETFKAYATRGGALAMAVR